MSDNIDIPIEAGSPDPINRLTSAIDRLYGSLEKLGTAQFSSPLQKQMAEMQQATLSSMQLMQASITTGFREMAALSAKGAATSAATTAEAVKAGAEKTVDAMAKAAQKMKEADARTWEQIQRGSAANVTKAFNQLAQGIPVEMVQKRYGELATSAAASMDGQLAKLRQFQANSKSLWETHYRAMAGASEAEIALAHRMNAARDQALRIKSASKVDVRTLLGLPPETEVRAAGAQIAAQMRESVSQEALRAKSAGKVDVHTLLGLPSRDEMKTIGAQIAAQMRESVSQETLRAKSASKVDTRTLLGLPSDEEARAAGRRIAEQMREGARAEQRAATLAEHQRQLNTSFTVASPGSQLRTAREAQVYAGLGGDAAARYGSAAATANIRELEAAYAKLHPAVRHATDAGYSHNDMMREGHSLARGLAGSLGGLWLTYGSLVPLLAGAAIAASLKGIVEAGKEVEAQLNFVTALTKEDVSLDRFLNVTDSSLRSVKESAEAMRMLAQNGLNANQSLRVLPAILDLATIGEMSVGQAALAATGATAAFGLQMGEAGRVADIFAITAANSNTSVLAMTESMKQASTVSSLFKVSIEETAGMLGLLAKINVTGSAAGTSMTNMLTGLYEPTEKGKKALKELGVETHLASGALKPLTQLLEEMQMALGRFNDSARVDLLGSIFTVRGVKSAELALQNIDEFRKKTEEARGAAGFMFEAVRQLEDSTAGVFDRLGVTVQNTFVKSFAEASPYVQRLGLDLHHAFKSEGTQTTLMNLATNVARLTNALFDNAEAIGLAVAGYAAFRMLGPTIALIEAAMTATAAKTAADIAATAAMGTLTSANMAGVASQAMVTAAIETSTAATVAGTAATVAWEAALLPMLGAAAIAAGVLGAAWLLLRDNTSDAERANMKITNSLDVVGEALDREIERLERVNALWDERNGKFSTDDMGSHQQVEKARMQVIDIETQILMSGGDPRAARQQVWQERGGRTVAVDSHPLAAALREADENLKKAKAQEKRFDETVGPGQNLEQLRQKSEQLRQDIEAVVKKSTETNSKGEHTYSPALREVFASAEGLKSNLDLILAGRSGGVGDFTAETLKGEIDKVAVDLKQIKDKANSMQVDRAPKGVTAEQGQNDAYRAAREGYDAALEVAKKDTETSKRDIEALYKAGEISAIEAARRVHDVEVALQEAAIQSAKDKGALALEHGKQTDVTKAEKDAAVARAGIREADAKHERAHLDMVSNLKASATQYAIEQARKEGNTALAYKLQHAAELAQVDLGLKDSEAMLAEALAAGDQKRVDKALAAIAALKEVKSHSDAAIKAAENMDAVSKAAKEFQSSFTGARAEIEDLAQQMSGGAGLAAVFSNALAAEQVYSRELDTLAAKQAALQEAANKSGLPEDQTKANNALRDMQRLGAQVRNLWVGVGQSIETALTGAFGRAGAAVGRLASISIQHSVKQKQINEDLAKHQGKDDYEQRKIQAMKELDSAQLTAYGNMAGAAKSYFEVGTKGYEALDDIERAFHAAQLVLTMKDMATKLFATEAVVTAKTTAAAAEGAAAASSVPVVVAAETAKSSSYGVTALAASLAQPFPQNLAAFATVAAMLAMIGVAVSGAGGKADTTAQDRQKAMGTGSVLGDANAKSDSIAKSLALVQKNTDAGLDYSAGMLNALLAIQNSIGGLANMVVRSMGLDGTDKVSGTSPLFSKGVSNALPALGALGGFAAGSMITLVGSIMGPIGAILGGVLGWAISKFSKVKTELLDQGLDLNSGTLGQLSQGVTGRSYSDVKVKKSFLGWTYSNDTDRSYGTLAPDVQRQFTEVIANLRSGIIAAVTVMGEGGDDFIQRLDSLAVNIPDISLKGLTGEQIQEQLNNVFGKIGDDLAWGATSRPPMAFTLTKFQQVGEGAFETLVRLAAEYQAVDAILQGMGRSFGQVGFASIEARTRLVELAGGLDEFTSQSQYFLKNFFSESEQATALKAQLQPTLSKFGLSADGPDAMKLFRDYVVGLDLTTEAGAQAYATLMRVAPALKTVADVAKEVADEAAGLQDQLDQLLLKPSEYEAKKAALERAQLDPANQALFDQVQAAKAVAEARERLVEAYNAEKQAMEANIDRLKGLADSWRAFRDGLLLGDKSTLTPQEKYLEAKAQFESTLARAQSGDVKAQAEYQSVAEKFLDASRVVNTSSPEYARDFERVRGATEAAIAWAEKQVTIEQASLNALEKQVHALANIDESTNTMAAAMARLTELLGQGPMEAAHRSTVQGLYQSLLGRAGDDAGVAFWTNALKAGGVSVIDVVRAITGSAEYINRATATAPSPLDPSTRPALEQLYRNLLGRQADQTGADYWMSMMQSGKATLNDVTAAMMRSPEYMARFEQPFTPTQGADQAFTNSSDLSAMAAYMRKMAESMDNLRQEQQQQTQDQIDAAFAASQAAAETMAEATAEAAEASAWANRSKPEFA